MTIVEMVAKCTGNPQLETVDLGEVISGGNAEDFVQDGDFLQIIEESKKGFHDKRFGKKATFVTMRRLVKGADNKLHPADALNEAAQANLSMFDRYAQPVKKMADGTLEADGNPVRADGDAVVDWKRAANAKEFMKNHLGKVIFVELKKNCDVQAWDRALNDWSETETRKQKVFSLNWSNIEVVEA